MSRMSASRLLFRSTNATARKEFAHHLSPRIYPLFLTSNNRFLPCRPAPLVAVNPARPFAARTAKPKIVEKESDLESLEASAARTVEDGLLMVNDAELEKALVLFKKALKQREDIEKLSGFAKGQHQPETVLVLLYLASTSKDLKNFEDAERYVSRAIDASERAKTNAHDVARVLTHAVAVAEAQGKTAEALAHAQRAVDLCLTDTASVSHDGTDRRSDVAVTLFNCARLHLQQAHYRDAEAQLQRAYRLLSEVLELNHGERTQRTEVSRNPNAPRNHGREVVVLCGVLGKLGQLCRSEGRLIEAEAHFVEEYNRAEELAGTEHQLTISACHHLAYLYRDQERIDQARYYAEQALTIAEKMEASEPDSLALLVPLQNLAAILDLQNEWPAAEAYVDRALRIQEKHWGDSSPLLCSTLNMLAVLYENQGKTSKVEPLYRRCVKMCEDSPKAGPNHPDTAIQLMNLSVWYYRQKQNRKADALHYRALDIFRETQGSDHPNTGVALFNRATVLCSMEQHEEAQPIMVEALRVLRVSLGETHEFSKRVESALASLTYTLTMQADGAGQPKSN